MESSFLFFFLGLSLYIISRVTKKKPPTIRVLIYIGTGGIAGGIIGALSELPLSSMIHIPLSGIIIFGGLTGMIFSLAESYRLMSRPGITYILTMLLGFILAALSFLLLKFYMALAHVQFRLPGQTTSALLLLLLIGFITAFGYTFPQRFFTHH